MNELTNKIIEKGKVHVYSHGDFDGICTAALFTVVFVPKDMWEKVRFTDVNYDEEKSWDDYPFDETAFNVSLDFKNANGLDVWVDHHQTGNNNNLKLPQFAAYDPTAPSAVHVLIKLIRQYNNDFVNENKDMLGKFLHWARVIDGAEYDNVWQVMKPKDNAVLFDMCFKLLRGPYDFFIRELMRRSLDFDELVSRNPLFRAGGQKAASEGWKCFFYSKENGQCTDQGLIIVDLIGSNVNFHRYAPWMAFESRAPKVMLACYVMSKNSWGMSLSKNPFFRTEMDLDLSKMAEKYGGGGHPNAAGISADSKEKIYEIMQACGEEIEKKLTEKKTI